MPKLLRSTLSAAVAATALAAALSLALAAPAQAATDTTPPVITSVTGPTTATNVTTSDQSTIVSVHVTDAGSGVAQVGLSALFSPDPASTGFGSGSNAGAPMTQVSGTAKDGIGQQTLQLPAGQWGSWNLAFTTANDIAGNAVSYSASQLNVRHHVRGRERLRHHRQAERLLPLTVL